MSTLSSEGYPFKPAHCAARLPTPSHSLDSRLSLPQSSLLTTRYYLSLSPHASALATIFPLSPHDSLLTTIFPLSPHDSALATIFSSLRITPVRQEQLKERLGERFRELDVPLLVEWPDGRREALLFVLEEESDSRRFSIHRLAHYCLDLAQLLKTDRVVPVVIFLRSGAYPRELSLGGDRHNYLNFRYLICDLSSKPFEQYRESDNIVARLNLPNMSYAAESRVEVYAQAVRGLLSLESTWEKQSKYIDFIDIYANLDHNELEQYRNQYPEEANKMTSFSERYIEKGIQQGFQQGEVAVLIMQMERKFGHRLTEADLQIVESADTETLLKWLEKVLSANSIEEVLH